MRKNVTTTKHSTAGNKFIVNPSENGMKNINCFYKNSPRGNIKEGGDARGGSIFETPPLCL